VAEPETFTNPPLSAESPSWRPGDDRPDIASMLRVNQAGEYGATRIYAGQLAALGDGRPASRLIAKMASQEQRHLKHFNQLLAERGVRPTFLQPFWRVAGHALGVTTALISPAAAMACTAAVEDEIDAHYSEQLHSLGTADAPLAEAITDFQADEREHRAVAIEAGAEDSFGYPLLYSAIRTGCRIAIELSKRI
jgi:ubiquinone biosynthesis monooxygenase Coq7